MTEQAIVRRLTEGGAEVELLAPPQACVRCGACGLFGAATAGPRGGRSLEVANPDSLPLQVGDTVEVGIESGRVVLAAFTVLGLPLVLFCAGYLAATWVGAREEPLRVAAGAAGGAAAFAYAALRRRSERDRPRVVGILHAHSRERGATEDGPRRLQSSPRA